MRKGDIWLLEGPNEKSRPVLIVTRSEAIPVLREVIVAPITSTIRAIPTAVPVGPDEGIDHDSVVAFDLLRAVPKSRLTRHLGQLGPARRHEMCDALSALADC